MDQAQAQADSFYTCSICMDVAKEPVVTSCGHLFCWRCLCTWLNISQTCPVCKSDAKIQDLIPVNGIGGGSGDHEVPLRPPARRVPILEKVMTSSGLRQEPAPANDDDDDEMSDATTEVDPAEIESMLEDFLISDPEAESDIEDDGVIFEDGDAANEDGDAAIEDGGAENEDGDAAIEDGGAENEDDDAENDD